MVRSSLLHYPAAYLLVMLPPGDLLVWRMPARLVAVGVLVGLGTPACLSIMSAASELVDAGLPMGLR